MELNIALDGTKLKIFAAIIMLIDHIGVIFFPNVIILKIIGRISFPIFCFFIAEGVYYTKDIKKYILRLFIAAVISEICFDYAAYGGVYMEHQNVMFTFLTVVVALAVFKYDNVGFGSKGILALSIGFILVYVIKSDYSVYGFVLTAIFYMFRCKVGDIRAKIEQFFVAGAYMLMVGSDIQRYAIFSLLPLWLYNGERGSNSKLGKYFFYVFYPAHLLLLYMVKRLLIS